MAMGAIITDILNGATHQDLIRPIVITIHALHLGFMIFEMTITHVRKASPARMALAARRPLDTVDTDRTPVVQVASLQTINAGAIAAHMRNAEETPKLLAQNARSMSAAADSGFASNCDQPKSGASGGDVQSRIIGYYEAWNSDKRCIGMGFQDIPVNSITHLYFSFGYISPGSFQIAPMDGLSPGLFSDLTALKKSNSALKTIVALGGWTFNDNGTSTQPVFSDIVSSSSNRSKFISNLLAFLRNYGFDGVDFDWEYPGAPDRGGNKDDGKNFTQLLKELKDAIAGGPIKYIVSFTAPTSYWYLRHFDIKGSVEQVDWVNVMSYDLHGVWDANNPIGSQVLAHTNLTEIKEALDLFWRNDVPADKIVMGLGFYGRSFQLVDPSCSTPGCGFKGGAAPGDCTDSSGTLSYKEIVDIIRKYKLTPFYDKTNAVKYITWKSDQWVSFDDKETIQQKITFANDQGLGGLLIWALDLDTPDLDALQAVIYPKTLGSRGKAASSVNNWQDANGGDCHTTDCGVTDCTPGETRITIQPCEEPDFFTGEALSTALCCPLSSAPDPKKCQWRGTGFDCNGQCHPNEVALESSAISPCIVLTGTNSIVVKFRNKNSLSVIGPNPRSSAATRAKRGRIVHGMESLEAALTTTVTQASHQVSLAISYDGEGEDCGWRLERQRSFCCDPPTGESPFLPVPLEYLFPHPPVNDGASTDFKLEVDPTYGGKLDKPFSDNPNNAQFGFVVMTSPEELQVSLDKRDGSHCEVFDCLDAVSEEEQTVRMTCADYSESSTCDKIHLGYGVPGTILEMPEGCGPGRYAVAKSLEISADQGLPDHLFKRGLGDSTVYDLTFDYDFRRVPRELGDTQVRIDYSNEPGYWDKVVDEPAMQRKRSLADHGGNHRRWLEEAWREDMHSDSLSREELHRRWFGSDALAWLKGLINGVSGGPVIANSFTEDFTVILMNEQWSCNIKGVDVDARLKVQANTHVEMDTNFGFTLITTLAFPPDLSKSYLYFRNKGEVTSKFNIDAIATAMFTSGDVELLAADKFGVGFTVPGILTIGPNFKLVGAIEGGITARANFEARVKLAKWDVKQTFPDVNPDWDPAATANPDRDGTDKIGEPQFDASVSAEGYIKASIKPIINFGIDFKPTFLDVASCTVSLVGDGHVTLYAEGSSGTGETSFCYGATAGADLYASVQAPEVFGWKLSKPRFDIGSSPAIDIVPKKCPIGSRDLSEISSTPYEISNPNSSSLEPWKESFNDYRLARRAQVYGPPDIFKLKKLGCPGGTTSGDFPCPLCNNGLGDSAFRLMARADGGSCPFIAGRTDESTCSGLSARDVYSDSFEGNRSYGEVSESHGSLVKRTAKTAQWRENGVDYTLDFGPYPECGKARDLGTVTKWYGFDEYGTTTPACPTDLQKFAVNQVNPSNYQTDHIFEAQTVLQFLDFLRGNIQYSQINIPIPNGYTAADSDWVSRVLIDLFAGGFHPVNNQNLFHVITDALGSVDKPGRMALVYKGVNRKKADFFAFDTPEYYDTKGIRNTKILQRDTAGVFQYLTQPNIQTKWQETSKAIENVLITFDSTYAWNDLGQLQRPARPNAGLRDLYCYWIDTYLRRIENNAAAWATNAKNTLENTAQGTGQEGKNWIATALTSGAVTPGRMRFNAVGIPPAPGSQWTRSSYDMWDAANGNAGPF
ncbi:MAG: hypothetical protein Q9187_005199 [Circinaria calcarea]